MAQPNIYKFRSREEIEAIIQAEVNKGNTFPVVLPRWKKSFLPKAEIIRALGITAIVFFQKAAGGFFMPYTIISTLLALKWKIPIKSN